MDYAYNGGCPAGEVCTVTAGFNGNRCSAIGTGHCCKAACPVGEPHAEASCAPGAYLQCGSVPGYSCHRGYLTPAALQVFGEMIDEYFPPTCCPQ